MKAILQFDLPEETVEHQDALNGTKYKCIIDDIWNEVFRPAMKHGYGTEYLATAEAATLNHLVTDSGDVNVAFELLAKIYQGVLKEEGYYE